MATLLERLRHWDEVYPEDMDKPEGSLYGEAYERLKLAIESVEACVKNEPRGLYPDHYPNYAFLKDILKELKK